MKIGMFLPSAVLVGVSMIFLGLRQWVGTGWVQESPNGLQQPDKEVAKATNTTSPTVAVESTWQPRRRPVLPAIAAILATHTIGLLAFAVINTTWFFQHQSVRVL